MSRNPVRGRQGWLPALMMTAKGVGMELCEQRRGHHIGKGEAIYRVEIPGSINFRQPLVCEKHLSMIVKDFMGLAFLGDGEVGPQASLIITNLRGERILKEEASERSD